MPIAVVLAALLFYACSLAPGTLWGDPGKLQRAAWLLDLQLLETSHPVWVALMHPIVHLPGAEPAWLGNAGSALLSSLALWPAFRIMRRLGATSTASVTACLALAVSHTYWLHAVVTEVYALNSLVALLLLDRLTASVLEGRPPSRGGWLLLGLAAGVFSANHLLVACWIPGFAWLAARGADAGRRRQAHLAAAGGLLAGLLPMAAARLAAGLPSSAMLLADHMARSLRLEGALADVSLAAACLIYQFPIPLVIGAALAGLTRLPSRVRGPILLLYGASVLLPLRYDVKDRFAFFLPSYLLIAVVAAPGLDRILAWIQSRLAGAAGPAASCLALLAVAAPPVVYDGVARRLPGLALSRVDAIRQLPGRDKARYHLYPGKRGETSAGLFAQAALAAVGPGAVLLADFTVWAPLSYLHDVERRRPDVRLVHADAAWHLDLALRAAAEGREVFVAAVDVHPEGSPLRARFELVPIGPIHKAVLRPAGSGDTFPAGPIPAPPG
ncbi:MAG TPA: DUF2723 domain-containing protein [Candidatus Polarisedimenticolia bacterium]|nr:DUF2723 domain-containing protein [Candidatus Polarisedimenticolia bacterium]